MDLSSLTPSQEQAVRHRGGPLMVLAGPGTGKTRTLTNRLCLLLEEGAARPDQCLAITFTNKAAEEMRTRVEPICRKLRIKSQPKITTFHGFSYGFLTEWVHSPFQLLSEQEAFSFLKEVVRGKDGTFPALALKELARHISLAKNTMLSPEHPDQLTRWESYPQWPEIYREYQKKLLQGKAWDFDELILQTVTLLEKDLNLREALQARYLFVFVDEFQDINPLQYRLFQLLIQKEGEWMVIGDPNQAIYGFRGADSECFSRLQKEFSNVVTIQLKESFRLNQTILALSAQVLEGSSQGKVLPLHSAKKGEPQVPVAGLASAESEGDYIAQLIEKAMGGLSLNYQDSKVGNGATPHQPRSFADFAVLYRLHAQGDQLAKTFIKKGIPFKKIQEIHWAEQPEVRLILKDLRSRPDGNIEPSVAVERALAEMAIDHQALGIEGKEALRKLRLWAATFRGSLKEFVETLSIQTGLDTYEPDQETVKLLTLHAAKGLEFPVVIIAGCEANLLPLTLLKESDLEEERRLFYVGLTRAGEELVLTWAKRRFLFGQNLNQRPSPFLDDMDVLLKQPISPEKAKTASRPKKKQLSLF
jgi:superfamily I DNA/RNA helicase